MGSYKNELYLPKDKRSHAQGEGGPPNASSPTSVINPPDLPPTQASAVSLLMAINGGPERTADPVINRRNYL